MMKLSSPIFILLSVFIAVFVVIIYLVRETQKNQPVLPTNTKRHYIDYIPMEKPIYASEEPPKDTTWGE